MKSSTSESKKTNDDKRFRDAYSKALAKALLDNEEQLQKEREKSQSKSQQGLNVSLEEAENVYKDLCFDYPLTPQFEESFALALLLVRNHFISESADDGNKDGDSVYLKALMPLPTLANSKNNRQYLALSNRFVEGVIETSTKASTGASTAAHNNHNGKNSKANDEGDDYLESYESYLKQPITQSNNRNSKKDTHSNIQGCNLLSFVVFALGPLLCIQKLKQISTKMSSSSSPPLTEVEKLKLMNAIQSFLGSYHATTSNGDSSTVNTSNYDDNAMTTDELLSSMNLMNILPSGTNTTSDTSYDKSVLHDNENDDIDNKNEDVLESDGNSEDNNDHDSLEEVWAEESDPDDYDYGNDRYANTATTVAPTIESPLFAFVDPLILSKKQKNRTIQNTIQCLHSLINELSYTKLSHLSKSSAGFGGSTGSTKTLWKEWNVTRVLHDLTLTLLQYSKRQDCEDENDIENILAQHLSMLYMKPLMVLRDRALEEFNSGASISSGMKDYTNLLNILLQSDAQIVGQFASQNIDNQHEEGKQLSPSRIIGLSSFSALCTSISNSNYYSSGGRIGNSDDTLMTMGSSIEKKRRLKELYRGVQLILLNNLDEFVDCIEFVRPRSTIAAKTTGSRMFTSAHEKTVPTWVRVSLSLLPILDFLTGIHSHSDFNSVGTFVSGQSQQQQQEYYIGLKTSDAQAVLQSGLFRELLLLYSSTVTSLCSSKGTTKSDVLQSAQGIIRLKLLRAILSMSAQAPTTLGKYAARVPDFTKILYSESFITHHLPDCTLWFALLSSLNSARGGSGSGGSQLRMKTSSSINDLSPDEIRSRCVNCSIQLCENVIHSLEELSKSKNVKSGESSGSEENSNKTHNEELGAIYNFNIFSNSLSQVPTLAQCWVSTLSNDKSTVQVSLSNVLKSLMKNQKIIANNESVTVKNDDIKDDSKKKGKTLTTNKSNFVIHCDKIRSSAKFLLLTIDDTNFQMSSKTD